ncbi:MAG TPA: aspartate kinase, partial [Bacteroidia bacterium]|nr:aspartate kinase [Bacteroidia bacterium]
MKVFKFGGASVKDAESVRNVAQVLKHYPNGQIIVVISAMGKITNALEKLVDAYLSKSNQIKITLEEIKKYHFDIIEKLFQNPSHPIYKTIHQTFEAIEKNLASTPTKDYNREYDQIVCQGEIISTLIISAYLNETGIKNTWIDARTLIRTDATYREGQVDFEFTEQLVKKHFSSLNGIVITQGFIGSSEDKSS